MTLSTGVKSALMQHGFIAQLINARSVATAAAAASLCRQQLLAKHDECMSLLTSSQDLSFPPLEPSLSLVPILIAVLSTAFSTCPNGHHLLSLLVSIGVVSDSGIPFISHDQLARIGVPSHSMDTLLSLVMPIQDSPLCCLSSQLSSFSQRTCRQTLYMHSRTLIAPVISFFRSALAFLLHLT